MVSNCCPISVYSNERNIAVICGAYFLPPQKQSQSNRRFLKTLWWESANYSSGHSDKDYNMKCQNNDFLPGLSFLYQAKYFKTCTWKKDSPVVTLLPWRNINSLWCFFYTCWSLCTSGTSFLLFAQVSIVMLNRCRQNRMLKERNPSARELKEAAGTQNWLTLPNKKVLWFSKSDETLASPLRFLCAAWFVSNEFSGSVFKWGIFAFSFLM